MFESLEKISREFSPTHEMLNLISEIDEFKGKVECFAESFMTVVFSIYGIIDVLISKADSNIRKNLFQ